MAEGGKSRDAADGRPAGRRITMKDVAKRAGVSQPTVSFVLSDRRDVSVAPATRERVLKAAKELKFQPNRAAQALRTNKSFTIGVIAEGIVSEPYAGKIVLGLQRAVQAAGYVCFVVETSSTRDAGKSAVENLIKQGVAGLIYATPGAFPVRAVEASEDTPTVFVNCWPTNLDDAVVVLADEYQGGRDAAAATFAAGHRRVVFLGGPWGDYACRERERGMVDAAIEAGIDPATIRREYGTYQVSSGHDLALKVLTEQTPTALICGNDRMAVGALLAVHSLGLECPGDVSIVGFDDQPDLADQLSPPLTTVALPHLEMGQLAGSLLLEPQGRGRHLVPCRYIARGSLAAPRTEEQ